MTEFCDPSWRCLGSCNPSSSLCECSDGNRNDYVLARFQNCGAPPLASEQAAVGFSIALGTLISFRNAYRYTKAKGRTKSVILCAVLLNMFLTASLIVHIVQGYASPAFWFLFAGFGGAVGSSLAAIFDAFLRVSYGAAMTKFPEGFAWASFALMVASLMVPFLICFVGSLQTDDNVYHNFLAVGLGLIPLHLLVSAPLFFSCLAQLIARTDAAAIQPIEALPIKMRAPSIFAGAIPQVPLRTPRTSDASIPEKLRRASTMNDDEGNGGAFKDQMRRMGRKLRLFRFVMTFIWAPFEVVVSAALTCIVIYRLPYLAYAFYVLINLTQLVSLTIVAVVKSTASSSSIRSVYKSSDHHRRPSLFPSLDGVGSDPVSSPLSSPKTPNF
jgi:hypothetical protein